mmetsp:Transcript_73127/g.200802  ORF Transcript_73127/g.200802 Transcript_73127/m.200802 type:complete len:333 (+) Transcript_73127:863-1861(+)
MRPAQRSCVASLAERAGITPHTKKRRKKHTDGRGVGGERAGTQHGRRGRGAERAGRQEARGEPQEAREGQGQEGGGQGGRHHDGGGGGARGGGGGARACARAHAHAGTWAQRVSDQRGPLDEGHAAGRARRAARRRRRPRPRRVRQRGDRQGRGGGVGGAVALGHLRPVGRRRLRLLLRRAGEGRVGGVCGRAALLRQGLWHPARHDQGGGRERGDDRDARDEREPQPRPRPDRRHLCHRRRRGRRRPRGDGAAAAGGGQRARRRALRRAAAVAAELPRLQAVLGVRRVRRRRPHALAHVRVLRLPDLQRDGQGGRERDRADAGAVQALDGA